MAKEKKTELIGTTLRIRLQRDQNMLFFSLYFIFGQKNSTQTDLNEKNMFIQTNSTATLKSRWREKRVVIVHASRFCMSKHEFWSVFLCVMFASNVDDGGGGGDASSFLLDLVYRIKFCSENIINGIE